MVLDVLYLIVFAGSIVSCQKMFGIEMMYIIQLGYYSLIPINIFCSPFDGLRGLKYSSGATTDIGNILNLEQAPIPSNYSSMGILSNFISNVNVVMVILVIVPLFYFPLKYIGNRSTHYRTKPRCLKYGKSLLCEVPLTILLFSSFSICTSFIVNIQAFGSSNFGSFAVSIVCLLLLPGAAVIFLVFKNHFSEFRE